MSSVDVEEVDSVDEEVDNEPVLMRVVAVLAGLALIAGAALLYYVLKLDHDGYVSFVMGLAGFVAVGKGLKKDLLY